MNRIFKVISKGNNTQAVSELAKGKTKSTKLEKLFSLNQFSKVVGGGAIS